MRQDLVGILLNDNLLRGIPKGRTAFERIPFYEEGAQRYGLTPIYFRLEDIHMKKELVNALVLVNGSYVKRTFPLPAVIHNRAMYFNRPKANAKLERLATTKGRFVFNRWNRYGKWHVHKLLMENPELRPHLPETVKATVASIRSIGRRHQAIIVKPSSSSIGRGIMKVDRTADGWRLVYQQKGPKGRIRWKTVRYKRRTPAALRAPIRRKPYIAQQRLPLAEYQGSPFDLRVSVQRGPEGVFQVTGIAAKVAKRRAFVTNVAQGGSVYRLEDVLRGYPQLQPAAVRESIETFSLSAAEHLSTRLPNLSDIGFDIGVTPDGYPVFIEMNLRDLRYSFREGGMPEEWRATYANPMGYAKYVLDGNAPN
ncbi:YheC/YheD family protein [Paenibacillus sp. TRM 82003]|nr:YheC/YheD family protein [Paenibacillus sp. TRM 82003]